MGVESVLIFYPFRLVLDEPHLFRDDKPIKLRPKSLSVLCYLAERPGVTVTKEELLDRLWPGTHVSATVVKVCVREIRKVLRDDAEQPQMIETVGTSGYRFIATLERRVRHAQVPLIAREREMARLQQAVARAMSGTRQLVFVTGEPGIGKTALVDAIIGSPEVAAHMNVGRGQCIEHTGEGEAYLSVMEALVELCMSSTEQTLVDTLSQYAPNWLIQMPRFVDDAELELLHRRAHAGGRERMLRELGETLEVWTADTPLLLVLEDVQWADPWTLEFLTYIGRHRTRCHLLIIATCRWPTAQRPNHPLVPLVQERCAHEEAEQLMLAPLHHAGVAEFLQATLHATSLQPEIAPFMHKRSGGNPLFLSALISHYRRMNALRDIDGAWTMDITASSVHTVVPERPKLVIERCLAKFDDDAQGVMRAASVVGLDVALATLVAACEQAWDAVESMCDDLVQDGLLDRTRRIARWPDGTVSPVYRWIHGLYRDALYASISDAKRRRMHGRIALRLQHAYRGQTRDIAEALAVHFESCGDYESAVRYHLEVATSAQGTGVHGRAAYHCNKALRLVPKVADPVYREQLELLLEVAWAQVTFAAKRSQASSE